MAPRNLNPKKPASQKPAAPFNVDHLSTPEIEALIIGTKDADPVPQEDPQKARRKAQEARQAEDAALARQMDKKRLAWLQTGISDRLVQTNAAIPVKLKMQLDHVLHHKNLGKPLRERTTISSVVTDLLQAWVDDRLRERGEYFD